MLSFFMFFFFFKQKTAYDMRISDWSSDVCSSDLSRGLKLDVIAEGIETEEQRSALLKLGCRCGQGFLFSKALSFDDFEQCLVKDRTDRPQQDPEFRQRHVADDR